ncbi:DUF4188 domain-containing protein [Halorussus salinisoli]|uniref:DUF4188 domain-containing protein n=1 Tax=Halorussus salinisoli TaxID=2558242 RepID=UPI0010C1C550|nr:DUF4188 domain-containing protein [Halorussus salinisoli]
MTELNTERVTAELEGDFAVFRIGIRINSLWKVHEWLPVFRAMPKMLDELEADPDSGLLGYDTKLGIRNHELVQYWRSFEDLREYALDSNARHAPAMQWTNEQMRESDDVGIWHETYLVRDDAYETVYDNVPPIGLGKAGTLYPATGRRRTAAGRLGWTEGDEVSSEEDGIPNEPVESE